MTVRFTNTILLILVAALTLSGAYGLVWTWPAWLFEIHRAAGWALVALVPWKAAISLRSLKRGFDRRFDRSLLLLVSLALAAVTLAVTALGLMWAWRVGNTALWLGQTAISWHWMLALGLLPAFGLHAWRRWPRPMRADLLSRRGALKLMAVAGAGALGWGAAEGLARLRAAPDSARRFTGSRESGSFSGNDFPVTHSFGDGKIRLAPDSWRLALAGAVARPQAWAYDELLDMRPAQTVASLDCTIGWYSTQVWRGVWLNDLLSLAGVQPPARSVRLTAASGYVAEFDLEATGEILLATHVGGERLDHWHGFPLRAVVPSRRGWFWVKWLTGVEVVAGPGA